LLGHLNAANSKAMTGSLTINANATLTTTGSNYNIDCVNLTINASATLTGNASTFTMSGNFDVPSGTYTPGTSTIKMTGTGHIDCGASNYTAYGRIQNLEIDASGGTVTNTNGIIIDGTMSFKNGTLSAPGNTSISFVDTTSSTAYSKTGGSYDTGGNMPVFFYLSSNGNSASPTMVSAADYPYLYLQDRGSCAGTCYYKLVGNVSAYYIRVTATTSGKYIILDTDSSHNYSITTTSNLLIGVSGQTTQNGKIVLNNSSMTIGGDLYIYGGGGNNILLAGTGNAISVAGGWSNSDTFTAGTSTVTFNGSAVQAITGANTFYNLTINNTAGTPSDSVDVDPAAAQTVTNNLTVTDGQYSPCTGDTYKNVSIGATGIMKPDTSASITVSGNWDSNNATATFTAASSTVDFTGTSSITTSSANRPVFYNLIVAHTNQTTTFSGNPEVTNRLTLSGTNTSSKITGTDSDRIYLSGNNSTSVFSNGAVLEGFRLYFWAGTSQDIPAGTFYNTASIWVTSGDAIHKLAGNVSASYFTIYSPNRSTLDTAGIS
jgi:hypothetical protein